MPAFFTDRELILEDKILIRGDDAFHIARSLRMAVGDALTVSDGQGTEYSCELVRIRDDECECRIISSDRSLAELPVDVTLYMAYPKGDKLETVVQKAVELGCSRIVPFESSRCIKRPKAEKADKQTERLMRIAKEAAKQCGRARLPEVTPPVSFDKMLSMARESELSVLCYEGERERSIKSVLEGAGEVASISVVVGSEGGFSEDEAAKCREAGLLSVTLGRRILRCETAPAYVLSAISYCFEL